LAYAVVRKPAPPLLYLPCTSLVPTMVTSLTSPRSTSCRNFESVISDSVLALPPAFTTCQSNTPESRITSQKATVLTVEFNFNAPKPTPHEPVTLAQVMPQLQTYKIPGGLACYPRGVLTA